MATTNRPAPGGRIDKTLGITERIAPPMRGWSGELRVRYTDFQVNEISKDGTVVHLQETKLPSSDRATPGALTGDVREPKDTNGGSAAKETKHQNDEAREEAEKAQEKPEPPPEVSAENIKILSDLANEDFTKEVIAIYQAAATRQPIPVPARSPVIEDKDQRSQVHQQVRRIFRGMVDTTTDQSDAGSVIVAAGRPPRPSKDYHKQNRTKSNRRGQGTGKLEVTGEGEYLHFTVYKENRDTMDAAHQLSRALRTKPQGFAFAGNKDRRAATAQRFSVRGLKVEAVLGANPRMHGVVTGDYRYETSPLYLGALQGNEFVITLKNCDLNDASDALSPSEREAAIRACAEQGLESMVTRGWLNYYGHQRFGTHAVGTHDVGRLILQGDYEGAVNAILAYDAAAAQRAVDGEIPPEPHARDELNRHRACMLFRDGSSADDALKYLPRRFAAEAAIIRHLGREPAGGADPSSVRRNFQGALLAIPRTLRMIYLHAYQSYIWNHAASHRWALHGAQVVAGDLVLDAAPSSTSKPDDQPAEAADPSEDDPSATARALSADEAASGSHSIHDVVLPTPGHSVLYPSNATGDFYASFMGLPANGALDPADMARSQRDFSLPGNYRTLTARFVGAAPPRVDVRRYARDEEQMHPTDLDRVREALRARAAGGAGGKRKREDAEEDAEGEGKKAKTEGGEAAEAVPDVSAEKTVEDAKPSTAEKNGEAEEAKDKVAVIVHFQLGKSAYATVALRELMGTPAEAEGEEVEA